MAAEASGRAFLGLIRFVKDKHGEDVLKRIIADAGEPTQRAFEGRIRIPDWYPYPAYVGFLRAIDRAVGKGDRRFCRELGAMAGQRDLGTIFRVFAALASPERLIRACQRIWPTYYRGAGRMEAIEWAPERTVLRIFDFPVMHPSHCRLMEGWMIATMTSIGCKVSDDAHESACTSKGAQHHEFTCTWSR